MFDYLNEKLEIVLEKPPWIHGHILSNLIEYAGDKIARLKQCLSNLTNSQDLFNKYPLNHIWLIGTI